MWYARAAWQRSEGGGRMRRGRLRTDRTPIVAAFLFVVAGCSGAATARTPPSAPSTPAVSPATTLGPTPTAARTPDIGNPLGIIAIGHSALTGEGTAGLYEANPFDSWATGSDPAVNSVYRRLFAARPETVGVVANTARGGAVAGELERQAVAALQQVPAPELVIVETIDNDIECDTANLSSFGFAVAAALKTIHDATPNSKILVVGQMGRPSIPYINDL